MTRCRGRLRPHLRHEPWSSHQLARSLLELGPSLVAELGLPFLVEGRLGERFAEGCGIRLVEGQTLLLQALLQAGIGLGHVIALFLGSSVEVLSQDLLNINRNAAPNASARNEPEAVPSVVGE